MKIRLLPFVITGLLAGWLCWNLSSNLFELQRGATLVTPCYQGVVLAIALLVLGKVLGMTPSGKDTISSAFFLFMAAVLAQVFVLYYHHAMREGLGGLLMSWELGLYPSLDFAGEPLIFRVFCNLLLPTPISSAIQASIIAFGVATAWDLKVSYSRIISRAAVCGALFAGLTILLTHLFSMMMWTDVIYEALNSAADQAISEMLWKMSISVIHFISLPLWYFLLFLAIYMAVRPQSSTAASTNELSTSEIPEIIATLRARKRTTRQFNWILLVIALFIMSRSMMLMMGWPIYRITIIIIPVVWVILFCWFEHWTLKKIPRAMDLSQWKAGTWRPSLLTLYKVDGFRYFHLYLLATFTIFSLIMLAMPPLWEEKLTRGPWLFYLTVTILLPLLPGLYSIPRLVVDYRLFAKGIPISCKKIDSKTEKLTWMYDTAGGTNLVKEYYNRNCYEAQYEGKLYKFWAPAIETGGDQTIALINPNNSKHGLLLNAFCESE
ncbi:MAG: hypothetical protein KAS94_14065 [Desulfobulbaceae bacterium]|nr:hypothetical protein [Desulfobulbaceae bacterium]